MTATASPSLSLVPGVILLPCQITLIIDSMMVMMTMVMLRMMRMMRMTRMMRMMMMAMGEIMISVVTNKMVKIFGSRTDPLWAESKIPVCLPECLVTLPPAVRRLKI